MKVKISLVVVFATLIAASLAYGHGYNLVSWPLLVNDTAAQQVFADSMGTGCQITGGNVQTNSDEVKYYDPNTSTWSTAWYRSTSTPPVWRGKLDPGDVANFPTVRPDRGYWIIIKGTHPAVTLTMTGSVNTAARVIPIKAGASENYIGTLFAIDRPLDAVGNDDCGLLASGFTGGATQPLSDKVRYFDGSSWFTAWFRTTSSTWKGKLGAAQVNDNPVFNPGNGYIIQVLSGHAFTGNQWNYIEAPAKGATVDLSSQTRTVKRQVSSKVARTLSPSTNQSLSRQQSVEEKKSK